MLNTSGYEPTEYKVLVRRKEVETQSPGGIIIPETTQEKEKFATMEGQLIAASHLAFTYATDSEWGNAKPKPGDKVLIAKYAGVTVKGKDGDEYVLVNDKDVMAFVKES